MKIATNHYYTINGRKFTVKLKHNKWHVAFSFNGKRVNRSSGLAATKENLKTVINVLLPETADELNAISLSNQSTNGVSDMSVFEQFAEEHFRIHKHDVRAHVYDRNYKNYKRHLVPYFSGKKLSDLNPMSLEDWQNKLLSKYKPKSVQKYRSILYGILDRAFKNELITKNPLDVVTAPKIRERFNVTAKDDINPFSQQEINLLISEDNDGYMSNFIQLMANTGCRPGEIIALEWNDIDIFKHKIIINKTIVAGKVGLPKTRSSIRDVDMLAGAKEALERQYKRTGHLKHVFVNSKNKQFFSHDVININLKKRLIKLGIPVRSLYQLRHSFASLMIQQGVDYTWVAATMGHKNTAITLQIYCHYIREDEATRLKKINKINQILNASDTEKTLVEGSRLFNRRSKHN